MARNKIQHAPLPASFKTIDEFAKFWETHDTEDYPDAWREVPVTIAMKEREYPRIVLEPTIAHKLDQRARTLGVSLNELVNRLLKDAL